MKRSALADPWIGARLPRGTTVEQRLSSAEGLYRAQDDTGRNLFAQFLRIDRLRTSSNWTQVAQRLRLIRSRRIAHFICAIEHDEYAVFLSEFVGGERLDDRLKREDVLELDEAIAIAGQVALALESMHALNLVHGRISPRSVVITRDSRGEIRATVCGFGVATGFEPRLLEPGYIPGKSTKISRADDVYSVGALLLQMVTGVAPRNAAVDEDIRDMAPSPLRSPSDLNPELARFRSLDQLMQDLTTSAPYRVATMERAADLLDALRLEIKTATPLPVARPRPNTFTGAANTGAASAIRTSPVGQSNRQAVAEHAGEPHMVRATGTSVRARSLNAGGEWARESTILRLKEHGIEGRVECLAANGDLVWFGTSKGLLGWFDLASVTVGQALTDAKRSPITSIAASPTLVVAGTRAGVVHYIADGEPVQALRAEAPVAYVTVADNGLRFAVGRSNGAIEVFEIRHGAARRLNEFEIAQATSISLSSDGKQIWLSDRDSTTIRDVATGANLGTVDQFDEVLETSDVIAALTTVGEF